MKKKEIAAIVIFLILISAALPTWLLVRDRMDHENYEKRELAEKPELSLSNVRGFPEQFEAYFDDHVPFRNQLVRIGSLIDYYIFHTSNSDNVTIGNSGWLYYTNPTDGDPLSSYKGEDLLNEKQLAKIADNMMKTKENLQKDGIAFAIIIAPNKERVYPEFMPWYYKAPAPDYAALQIYRYLKENTDVSIVYPYEELMKAKEQIGDQALIYHKTDSHWNKLGAYIGTRELLRSLGIALPDETDQSLAIARKPDEPGDLADMLNLAKYIDPGTTYEIEGLPNESVENTEWDFYGSIRYQTEGADPRKILVVRDSFCSNMAEYIGAAFRSSVMIHIRNFKNEMVREEKPDIVVIEIVERRAPARLLKFVYK